MVLELFVDDVGYWYIMPTYILHSFPLCPFSRILCTAALYIDGLYRKVVHSPRNEPPCPQRDKRLNCAGAWLKLPKQ